LTLHFIDFTFLTGLDTNVTYHSKR